MSANDNPAVWRYTFVTATFHRCFGLGIPIRSNATMGGRKCRWVPSLASLGCTRLARSRPSKAMAATLGGVFIRLPIDETVSDEALLDVMLELGAKSGEFHQEIKDALEDGRIKPDEHQRIAKRGWSYIRAVMECVSRIEGMVDDK